LFTLSYKRRYMFNVVMILNKDVFQKKIMTKALFICHLENM
jgi:hypothetical protein